MAETQFQKRYREEFIAAYRSMKVLDRIEQQRRIAELNALLQEGIYGK